MLTLNKVLMASAVAMMTLTRPNVADLVNCTRQGGKLYHYKLF